MATSFPANEKSDTDDVMMGVDDVTRLSYIAGGTYSELFLGRHDTLGLVVMKTLYTNGKLDKKELSNIEDEIKSLVTIATGPHLLPIHGFIRQAESHSFILDYLKHGSIRQLQNKTTNHVPFSLKCRMVVEVLAAMLYLHDNHVVHGNLKRDNILIDDNLHIKITDFGITTLRSSFSSFYGNDNNNKKRRSCRNLCIIPPEYLIDPSRSLHDVFDIYSFGIVLWEFITGLESYPSAQNSEHLMFSVCQGCRPGLSSIPEECPKLFSRIMQECWDDDSGKRPPFHDLHSQVIHEYHNKHIDDVDNAVLHLRSILTDDAALTYDENETKNHQKYPSEILKDTTHMSYHDNSQGEDIPFIDDCKDMDTEESTLLDDVTSHDIIKPKESPDETLEKKSTPLESSELCQVLFGLLAMGESDQEDTPKHTRRRYYSTGSDMINKEDGGRVHDHHGNGNVKESHYSVRFSESLPGSIGTAQQFNKSKLSKSISFDDGKEKHFPKHKRLWKRHSWWSNSKSLSRTQSAYTFEERALRSSSMTEIDAGGALGRPDLSLSVDNISLSSNTSSSLTDLAMSLSSLSKFEPELTMKLGDSNLSKVEFRNPRGAVVSSEGDIFICDAGNRKLRAFTSNQSLKWKFPADNPSLRSSKKLLFDPREVILTKDEKQLLVSDYSSDSVLKISTTGAMVTRYISPNIRGPWGLALDSEGLLYVVSHKSSCIVVMKCNAVIRVIGKFGMRPGTFRHPTCLSIDSRDNIYVADTRNCRVQVLSPVGHFLFCIGDKRTFPCISGIAVDECNNLYIADEKLGSLWVYNVDGECKTRIRRCIGDKKFVKPQGVSVTCDGAVTLVDKTCVRLLNCWQFHQL